jgi:phage FluMu protein Com
MADELKCDFCKKISHDVVHYHQRTQYVEEEQNWVNACPECKLMNDEYWDGMWAELYGDIGSGVGA